MFILRLLRGCHAVRRVNLACGSSRYNVVSLLSRERLCTPGLRTLWSSTPCRKGRTTGHWDGGDNGDWSSGEEDEEDDENVEELLVSRTPNLYGAQKIVIVHPDVKWGDKRQRDTTAELLVAEAVALIHSIPNWIVVDKLIMSTKSPDHKYVFGKGNFQTLTEKIKAIPQATAVFLNIERISPLSENELEAAWGVKVFDRYTVVLNIFRYNARTREAKLQIALAELPLLRSLLRNEMAHLDQQSGGSRYVMGSGETLMEIQQRLLKERELKLKKALEKLRKKRKLLRTQRKRREFPVISVMGYTNSGKTTLIKALTGDANLQPRDQLFATLDVTAHGGLLPCRMPVIYVDTIGFLSQLPHNLIESFSATLEDVIHSDLLIHVRDISHPEAINQKKSVLNVLSNLNVPQKLLDTMIEVHNKIDLVEEHDTKDAAIPVSALIGYGLEDLKQRIETEVMESTGRIVATIRVNLESAQLSWLYKEASVQEVKVLPEDGAADVLVIITSAAYGKYTKLFCK
ncbi:PREDICTED: putative GTP-binding protein 6 [Nanorana parkeri]|uniref:putative GTP-binding protein 6 n=1 Tax=Nanorana parkeri TaxID=125878 RepID=UPI0008548E4D|nr:PREDICTED: putative GTP-binding protein 6 [Nanorana parkeri]